MVHQPPKKEAVTRANGSKGLLSGVQLLLQVLDAGFPMFSTTGQITNRYTQFSNLLLFLGGALFPQISARAQFSCLASSIPIVIHHGTSIKPPPWRDPNLA
jgi:hypothetical protein